MLRITKLTDYGIVLLVQLANGENPASRNARSMAEATSLPLPVVSKILKSLAPGGTIAIRDFILDEEGDSPEFAAVFAVNMLVNTKGGKSYRESEVAGWLSTSGFDRIERVDLPDLTSLIKGKRPA